MNLVMYWGHDMNDTMFRVRSRLLPLAVVACCAVLATGCSRSTEKLVPVDGRVLVNEKPAIGTTVTFHPVNGAVDAPRPSGQVGVGGTFRLTTLKAGDGAAPGEYKVTVAWYAAAPTGKRAAEGDGPPPKNQLPETYARADTTPLQATVSAERNDPLTFKIKLK